MELIDAAASGGASVSVIDIGGRESFWQVIPRDYLLGRKVSITIVNITEEPVTDPEIFTAVVASGTALKDVRDQQYDIAVSNSVIEHVGNLENMARFAAEVRRVAKKYYVQTPNFWFPIEPHYMCPFIHWMPLSLRVWLVRHFNIGNYLKAPSHEEAVRKVNDARLLTSRLMMSLFPDAVLHKERFALLTKSLIAIKD